MIVGCMCVIQSCSKGIASKVIVIWTVKRYEFYVKRHISSWWNIFSNTTSARSQTLAPITSTCNPQPIHMHIRKPHSIHMQPTASQSICKSHSIHMQPTASQSVWKHSRSIFTKRKLCWDPQLASLAWQSLIN